MQNQQEQTEDFYNTHPPLIHTLQPEPWPVATGRRRNYSGETNRSIQQPRSAPKFHYQTPLYNYAPFAQPPFPGSTQGIREDESLLTPIERECFGFEVNRRIIENSNKSFLFLFRIFYQQSLYINTLRKNLVNFCIKLNNLIPIK